MPQVQPITIPCEPCNGTGRTEAVDWYGQFDSCDACKGEGRVAPEAVARRAAIEKLRAAPLAEQLAAMEAAEIRQEQKLLAFADELRGNLDKLERALRGEVSR